MSETIDLRSDTVTLPTPAMREAMAQAPVGDDVYGEDPTINKLQELAAEMTGMEAGLFVPSGTMGNLIAVLVHCQRGEEIILGNMSHIYLNEAGGVAALGGVHPYPLLNQDDGTIALEDIRAAIRTEDPHHPVTRMIALENTHNTCGGVALSVDYTRAVSQIAQENDLWLHLDGARLFNAAIDLGVTAKEVCDGFDSVTFCLSKGLGAPVGSVLCGTKAFIYQANRIRKQLGGGMRQAGIVAAAGIVALEQMVDRLKDDHKRAKRLADGLAGIKGIDLDLEKVQTNMIYFRLQNDAPINVEELEAKLLNENIKVDLAGPGLIRLVTHCWIDDAAVEKVIQVTAAALEG
ncbi:MAG: low-specificity L-threonine aldolase [Anaerolineae bacterium]|nr:low-specificity L-threonine aldolase [Anaerolineae bacterium]